MGSALLSFDVEEYDAFDDPTEGVELNDLLLEAECDNLELNDSSVTDDECNENDLMDSDTGGSLLCE